MTHSLRRHFPESAVLSAAAWSADSGELFVVVKSRRADDLAEFGRLTPGSRRWRVYRYELVPEATWLELITAASPGSYFNDVIRARFATEDLSPLDWPADRAHLMAEGDLVALIELLDTL